MPCNGLYIFALAVWADECIILDLKCFIAVLTGGFEWDQQFDKNTRRELGGASFVDAYWRARYYGFIDEETANVAFEN